VVKQRENLLAQITNLFAAEQARITTHDFDGATARWPALPHAPVALHVKAATGRRDRRDIQRTHTASKPQ
jgi:hypothetical protein